MQSAAVYTILLKVLAILSFSYTNLIMGCGSSKKEETPKSEESPVIQHELVMVSLQDNLAYMQYTDFFASVQAKNRNEQGSLAQLVALYGEPITKWWGMLKHEMNEVGMELKNGIRSQEPVARLSPQTEDAIEKIKLLCQSHCLKQVQSQPVQKLVYHVYDLFQASLIPKNDVLVPSIARQIDIAIKEIDNEFFTRDDRRRLQTVPLEAFDRPEYSGSLTDDTLQFGGETSAGFEAPLIAIILLFIFFVLYKLLRRSWIPEKPEEVGQVAEERMYANL